MARATHRPPFRGLSVPAESASPQFPLRSRNRESEPPRLPEARCPPQHPQQRGGREQLRRWRSPPHHLLLYSLWSPLLLFVLNPAAELSGGPVRLDRGYLEGDALDDAAGDAPPAPVVELGGGGVGVPDQVLDLFDGDVLREQGSHDHDAEGMRRQVVGEPG